MLVKKNIPYHSDNTSLMGYLVYDDEWKEPRPGVLISHAWKGLDDFAKRKAEEVAGLGYVAFAADVYGRDIHAESDEEAAELMMPLFKNRGQLRQRIYAGYYILDERPEVDSERMGAIGFCFGGLTALELLRSGAKLRGTVSFHGVLGNQMGDVQAVCPPDQKPMHGSVLILHGEDDPLVSEKDILELKKELTEEEVDWQMNIYGSTSHAFTNPSANDREKGLIYNERAAKRSWQAMQNFFEEVF